MTKLLQRLMLPKEISAFERAYLKRMNRVAGWFFLCHPPVLAIVAWLSGTNVGQAAVFSTLAIGGPLLAARGFSSPRTVSLAFGFTAMTMGALLTHFGKGPMQIEMHFYFFVSLALLAVFANPMVIVVATSTVVAHHVLLYFLLPSSVFNYDASIWTVVVHALFVLIEAIAGCFVARTFFNNVIGLEKIVSDRTEELRLETEQRKLSEARIAEDRVRNARAAGMAEVATGVLHNVGNALNSVNVSVSLITEKLRATKLPGLSKATTMFKEHETDLAHFVTEHAQGKRLPAYLGKLSEQLTAEHDALVSEIAGLHTGVAHITAIVGAQQSLAKGGSADGAAETTTPAAIVDEALLLALPTASRDTLNIVKTYEPGPPMLLDRHRLLQILVNLIRNASQAIEALPSSTRTLELITTTTSQGRLNFIVRDSGVGIAPETKVKLFTHGFTTRKEGHGFGMHASACAAMEMEGTLRCDSAGFGFGATFTIDIPRSVRVVSIQEAA